MSKRNKINRSDNFRVLLTETLPYETPLNFSADYIYAKIRADNTSEVFKKIMDKVALLKRNPTIPYHYQIRKTKESFRRLALIHPNSQMVIETFYKKSNALILHYTSRSSFSIRSPHRVAGSFYTKSSWENIYKYKDDSKISGSKGDYAKHAPSYFSYRGYDRLWKFYSSSDYVALERRYPNQVSIDVAKCFNSIYTHCIGWAAKEKQFVKDNLGSFTFGEDFDSAIRHGNHNETNGIPIGPEYSRIFSEIILQRIDMDVQRRLSQYIVDKHYVVRRYVDDINIFAQNETTADSVKSAYIECLLKYNLHINDSKTEHTQRPYSTKKSTLIRLASDETDKLLDNIFVSTGLKLGIATIFKPDAIFKQYITSLKSICHLVGADFYDLSSWVIAVLDERVKKICDSHQVDETNDDDRFKCFKLILDICFFLYGVAPSVSASYKLSTVIVLSIRYFEKNQFSSRRAIKNHVFHCIARMLEENSRPPEAQIDEFIDLEVINIVLASRELGNDYLLPLESVRKVFSLDTSGNYFTISAGLFYIGTTKEYEAIAKEIFKQIESKLGDCSRVFYESETAHIFLDAIGCPYIPVNLRRKWIRNLIDKGAKTFQNSDLEEFLSKLGPEWVTCWEGVDLLTNLERRELKSAY